MNNSRLIAILRTFTKKEFRDFEKFVDSPYFSTGRDLTKFLKALKPYYPHFEDEKFTLENLYISLFPANKYDEKTSDSILYKLSSELCKLSREFLVYEELQKSKQKKSLLLLNQLRVKKLFKEFEKEYKDSESLEEDTFRGGIFDFSNKFLFTVSCTEYSFDRVDYGSAFESILLRGEYAVLIALIMGFRNIDTNNSFKAHNFELRYNLVDNFVKHLDSEMLLEEMKLNEDRFYPYVAVSHGIHKMFEDMDNDENYYKFKELVQEHISLFGHSERYILFHTMVSYCIIKTKSGSRRVFVRELFSLYESIYKLGIYKYSETDFIQVNSFRAVVICASDNDEIDWLENYVRSYINEVDIKYRENMKHYALANICFKRKDYGNALNNLLKIKFDVILLKIDVKILMLKIYFEQGHYEQVHSIIDTIKHYISNTKDLSKIFKLRERNFIKYAGRLLKEKTSGSKSGLQNLQNEIEKEEYVGSRFWLIKIISEME